MKRHFYLLINEHAGGGNGAKAAKKIIAQLQKIAQPYTVFYTEYAGHEKKITEELAQKTLIPWSDTLTVDVFPLLVVFGGDGTLHGVMNALDTFDSAIPIGYIPCGSGNDFARGVGIDRPFEKAFLQLLRADQPQSMQLLTYNEGIQAETGTAINNVGIGLDAGIVHSANTSNTKSRLNKYNMGSFAYIFAVLKVLFTQKGFPILVECNGKTHEFQRAFLCTITNHPYFGGGVRIAPMANPKKNVFDLVIVERLNLLLIFWLIFLLMRKKHTHSKYFHHFQSSKFRLVSTVPEYVQADGEILGKRSVDIAFSGKSRLIWF